ncbi:hypothetical protein NSB25_15525 [Acetatifactor muris]|uniref:Uncharacterized protein n=1 Tax=Acetatifactor muris TaxID=879566 RepID=A0A2K4ZIG6_9FIRM|nr:hypothetical protein [Acetatifactor muris]MCR2048685.1 hypothetical protein [Acetatifactor muris]SOY30254.1 hypothetical protein AMURIS_02980 [Acetatifactor muris]
MFEILAFFTALAGIATGVKTGLDSAGTMDDENKSPVNITIRCLTHGFFWAFIYTLPVYLLQKFWWIALIIVVIGVIVHSSKKDN